MFLNQFNLPALIALVSEALCFCRCWFGRASAHVHPLYFSHDPCRVFLRSRSTSPRIWVSSSSHCFGRACRHSGFIRCHLHAVDEVVSNWINVLERKALSVYWKRLPWWGASLRSGQCAGGSAHGQNSRTYPDSSPETVCRWVFQCLYFLWKMWCSHPFSSHSPQRRLLRPGSVFVMLIVWKLVI